MFVLTNVYSSSTFLAFNNHSISSKILLDMNMKIGRVVTW